MTLRDDWWKGKLSRADADYQRETFTALHQRQTEHLSFVRDQQDWVTAGHFQIGGTRLRVYTKIFGDLGGIIWKNLAEQKVRQAYLMGLRTWHHEFNIGIVDVTIDLYGRTIFITLNGAVAYFEFQTSGRPVVVESVDQEGAPIASYKTAVIGVAFDGKKTNALIRTGERKSNAADASRIGRPQQVNLIDEPVIARSTGTQRTNKKTKYPNLLFESWAPNHPHTGVFLRAYNEGGGNGSGLYSNRGSLAAHMTRDILFDVPYMDSHGLTKVRPAYIRGDADWPRASSVQSVTSTDFGTREFGIYVDAFNQLFVFPTSQIQGIDPDDKLAQNVPERYVQGASIPLPGWVYVPPQKASEYYAATHGVQIVQAPELDWKFHPAGTKACAVVHERQAASFDAAYFAGGTLTEAVFNNFRDFSTGIASRNNAFEQLTFLPQRYCIGTGLVEVSVQITLTGNDPENYTLALDVTEVRRPTTAQHATLLAGYVWYDIEADPVTNPKTYLVDRGDLCVLDVERYYRAVDGATYSFMSVKKLTAGLLDDAPIVETELRAWNASQIIDYDFPTLSFVFSINASETVVRTLQKRTGLPAGTGTLPYSILHPAISVTTFNKFRQNLFPDTIPLAQKELLASRAEGDARIVMADAGGVWTFMPLNDSRTWATAELSGLRDFYVNQFGYKTIPGTTAPSAALGNWWAFAMNAYFVPTALLIVAAPKFGWHVYADELMNRLAVSPASTFFVHPNGTWAFFDQHRIYNPYGMFGPIDTLDALTPAIAEMELEHVIYDAVHLENKIGSLDTSFIDLYNAAVAAANIAGTVLDIFDPITKDNLRATFIKQRYTHTSGVQWLQVKTQWYPGYTGYYMETGYQGGPYAGGAASDAGGLLDLTFGALFYPEPAYGGSPQVPYGVNNPVTFSTCTLIV